MVNWQGKWIYGNKIRIAISTLGISQFALTEPQLASKLIEIEPLGWEILQGKLVLTITIFQVN